MLHVINSKSQQKLIPWVRTKLGTIVATCSYLTLSGLVLYHIWPSPTTRIDCGCGDPGLFTWFLAYQAFAITHLHNPFFTHLVWAPNGANLLNATSIPLLGMVMTPFTLLFGPIFSFNISLFLSPVLSALAARWCYRSILQEGYGGFAGGLLFGFSPEILTEMGYGHLNFIFQPYLPIALGLLYLIFTDQSHVNRRVALLSLSTIFEFFVSTEILPLTILLMIPSSIIVLGLNVKHKARINYHALKSLFFGGVLTGIALAYPTYYSLFGPRHITGGPWSSSWFYGTGIFDALKLGPFYAKSVGFERLGGYFGIAGPNPSYLGPTLVIILTCFALTHFKNKTVIFAFLMLLLSYWFAMGGILHLSPNGLGGLRETVFLPWRLVQSLPIFTDALPGHLIQFMWLFAGLLFAAFINFAEIKVSQLFRIHASDNRKLSKFLISISVITLSLLPSSIYDQVPLSVGQENVPSWFTQGSSIIKANTNVLVIPLPYGIDTTQSMVWQAIAGFRINVIGGSGIFVPGVTDAPPAINRKNKHPTLLDFLGMAPKKYPSQFSSSQVNATFKQWHVGAVLIQAIFANLSLAIFFNRVFHVQPITYRGAWVWETGY